MRKVLLCLYLCFSSFFINAKVINHNEYTTPALDFSGIGLLKVANKKNCTATLVSPNTILTAAHCVYDSESGQYYPPKFIKFRPAKASSGQNEPNNFVAIKTYTVGMRTFPKGNFTQNALMGDWALITLSKPLNCALTKLALTKANTKNSQQLIVAGFPKGSENELVIDKSCEYALPPKQGNMIRLKSCQLKHGDSGAPLMRVVEGKLTIIGTISAGVNDSKGRYRVFAVPNASFAKRTAQLNQVCQPEVQ
ncbi:MAG: trypsin-like serine peptidase [Colwellia sp.]